MKVKDLIADLGNRDPEGDVQIFGEDDGDYAYYEIREVNGFDNSPNVVIECGEFIGGSGCEIVVTRKHQKV